MAKPKKSTRKSRNAIPKLPAQAGAKPVQSQSSSHAVRETIESIVIAFVLAFLFRTFEAEAFVIPTGSMAPTLMGRHKDVDCPECGYRFKVGSSEEESSAEVLRWRNQLRQPGNNPLVRENARAGIAGQDVVGGMCPMCRHVMPMVPNLPPDVPEMQDAAHITEQPSYNGDRILVNKYIYSLQDPQRWDVVVFKFPGDAAENYIKRLVGLPNETLRIYQGNLFVRDDTAEDADFQIARKPPRELRAMRQLVHDTDYDPSTLYHAGWPLRWQAASDADAQGWQTDVQADGETLRERFTIDRTDGEVAWLRYWHTPPSYEAWQRVEQLKQQGGNLADAQLASASPPQGPLPQLITDYNMYNGRVLRAQARQDRDLSLAPLFPPRIGIHWVGDLMVEADVDVKSGSGELLLDLVKGGKHFTCGINLADGLASLEIPGRQDAITMHTPLQGPGTYRVALANVDDRLLLWVDDELVEFQGSTAYDAEEVYGQPNIRPQTSADDPGDLAPVGIGVRDANVEISHLQVWRDIYYIADRWDLQRGRPVVTDFEGVPVQQLTEVARNRSLWHYFLDRRQVEFPLGENQLFVMGDNSAESSDARLWKANNADGGIPGGAYLEERLLIGKALCVYWPHSWNRIPGTPIPFPLFPNFADMRIVR